MMHRVRSCSCVGGISLMHTTVIRSINIVLNTGNLLKELISGALTTHTHKR